MSDRKLEINQELKRLYSQENDIADSIQELLAERARIQEMENYHLSAARLKSQHARPMIQTVKSEVVVHESKS